MDKSPISILSEYCQKHKSQLPTYEFIRRTDNNFECHITVLNIKAIGIALNKSDAKREAAVKLLQNERLYVKELENPDNNIIDNSDVCKSCVSILMEYCQKQLLPMPTFSWSENSITKQFTCTATAADTTAIGTGQNKMKAKQNAAYNVITKFNSMQKIKNDTDSKNTISETIINDYKYDTSMLTSDKMDKLNVFESTTYKEQDTISKASSMTMDVERPNSDYTFDKFSAQELVAKSNEEQRCEIIDITQYKPPTVAMKAMSISGDADQPVAKNTDAATNSSLNYSHAMNMYRSLSKNASNKKLSNVKMCDRHNYFLHYPQKLKEAALKVVRTEYASTKQQALDVLKALQIDIRTKILNSYPTGKMISIELLCEYDVIFAEREDKIYNDIVKYFKIMLL